MGLGEKSQRKNKSGANPSNSSTNSPATASNRFSYPGNRAAAASSPPPHQDTGSGSGSGSFGMPGPFPRTGNANLDSSASSTASAPPNLNPNQHPGQTPPVLRGSHVDPPGQHEVSRSVIPPPPPVAPAPQQAPAATGTNRPGAYQVTRTSSGPAQVYRVTVPAGVRPGTEFTVHAGARRVRVRCPANSRPGQSLQITLPPESVTNFAQLRMAPLTAAMGAGSGGSVAMTPDVQRVNEQARESGGSAQTYLVTIPPNIYPGMQFTVNVAGQRFMVSCPQSAGPNMRVRIVPPVVREEPEAAPRTQVFEVAVPPGVQPGQPFALVANSQRVLVTCPPNVVAGQKIRFQLPVSQVVGNIQLAYESEQSGWKRTIRATDLKFQWTRVDADAEGGILEGNENTQHFDFMKSAYVRKMTFLEGNDARMRTGTVELVPATEAVVDSRMVVQNRTLMSYADVHQMQNKSLAEKKVWFDSICEQLKAPWEDGHLQICVRRSQLLLDSVDAIMAMSREDMRKRWKFEFLGEPAIDVGGPTREWFELVSEQVFDPACGLWVPSTNNQACVDINPGSGESFLVVQQFGLSANFFVCVCVCGFY